MCENILAESCFDLVLNERHQSHCNRVASGIVRTPITVGITKCYEKLNISDLGHEVALEFVSLY